MEIVIINFSLDGLSEAEYRAKCDEIAPAFAAVPGLVSKVWLADTAGGVYGGVYTFEDGDGGRCLHELGPGPARGLDADVRRRLRAPLRSPRRTDRGHPGLRRRDRVTPGSMKAMDRRSTGSEVIGRDAELSVVLRVLEDHGPRVCFVYGIAGIGKSTLLAGSARSVNTAASTSSRLTAEASSRRRRVFSTRSDSSPARRGWTPPSSSSTTMRCSGSRIRGCATSCFHGSGARYGSWSRDESPRCSSGRSSAASSEVSRSFHSDLSTTKAFGRSCGPPGLRTARSQPRSCGSVAATRSRLRLALEARLARVDVPSSTRCHVSSMRWPARSGRDSTLGLAEHWTQHRSRDASRGEFSLPCSERMKPTPRSTCSPISPS